MLYFNWCHIVWGSFSIVTVSRILFTTPFLRSDECLGFLAHFQIFCCCWTGHTLWGKKNLECDRKKKSWAVVHMIFVLAVPL